MIANERSFPAVGKNGKSIIVTGLTDFAMTKTLNDTVSLSYLTIFLFQARRKFTTAFSMLLNYSAARSPLVNRPAAATATAAIIDSVVCD